MKPILKVAALEKQVKNKEKAQEKVHRLKVSLAAKERERNAVEERLNSTKLLDYLKERKSKLQHQNKEEQPILQDENASPSDREAAKAQVGEKS